MTYPLTTATAFEVQVRKLGLDLQTCVGSKELRQWCEGNKTGATCQSGCLSDGEYWSIRTSASSAGPTQLSPAERTMPPTRTLESLHAPT